MTCLHNDASKYVLPAHCDRNKLCLDKGCRLASPLRKNCSIATAPLLPTCFATRRGPRTLLNVTALEAVSMSCDRIFERIRADEPPSDEEGSSRIAKAASEEATRLRQLNFASLVRKAPDDFLREKLRSRVHLLEYQEAVENKKKYVLTQGYASMKKHCLEDAENYRRGPSIAPRILI